MLLTHLDLGLLIKLLIVYLLYPLDLSVQFYYFIHWPFQYSFLYLIISGVLQNGESCKLFKFHELWREETVFLGYCYMIIKCPRGVFLKAAN